MSDKKRVLLGILITSVIVLSVVSVSAGWFSDLFGRGDDLEGELETAAPAVASVDVIPPTTPPEIVFVSDALTINGGHDLAPESNISFNFSFLAWSVGGPALLPTTPFGALGGFRGGFNGSFNGADQFVYEHDCFYIGLFTDVTNIYAKGVGQQFRNYSCGVRMWYFYDPTTWYIWANLTDTTGTNVINNSRTFDVDSLSAFRTEPFPPYANWSSIAIASPPTAADNYINITNQGNVNIAVGTNPLQINATPLNGTGVVPADQILGTSFLASESTPCTGTSLLNGQFQTVAGFTVDHDLSSPYDPEETELMFCIGTLTGIQPQLYNTTIPWTIKAFE